MNTLEKNFDRAIIEEKWSKKYLDTNAFVAGKKKDLHKPPYVIMMPPPNVTGALHNGHALFVTLQDILARFWRMKGYDVLWLPGTDHAGISTQTVVERELLKKEGKTKHDLGRSEFLKRVFAWKDKHGDRIIEQLKLLGASADWSRLRFTMDEQCSHAVSSAFVKLWNDGLIYRQERLISWDPSSKTALSDEEVEHIERDSELIYFAYKIKNSSQEIIVATTRLETMLGDVAVCVNPTDGRYQSLVGQELVHPFFPTRTIKIIADDYVEKEFGSGAVKITPAHDPNDFLIGQRHNLPNICILDFDACINNLGGEFKGLDRFEARKKIKEKLEVLGLFRKLEIIKNSVSISQRSLVEIEPMLSKQYFVDAKLLAKMALKAVNEQETNIIPAHFKKTWDHFLENIQDWCISRQLWWGHRIPVYYHINSMKEAVIKHGSQKDLSCYKALQQNRNNEEVLRLALDELDDKIIRAFSHAKVAPPIDVNNYLQEEDVLDTWFSSGLWPFSTLGWPNKTDDLHRYYPSAVLETGSDILFFLGRSHDDVWYIFYG
jgi:valyl-tRNA synthetase